MKPVSAMVAAVLEMVLSLLAGWGGLAVGDEEAIPTDGLRRIVEMVNGKWRVCLLCNVVVYAKLARVGLRRSCRKRWVRWDGGKVTEGERGSGTVRFRCKTAVK